MGNELFSTDDFNGLGVSATRIDELRNCRYVSPCQAYLYYCQWYSEYGDADFDVNAPTDDGGNNGNSEHGPDGSDDDTDPGRL